MAVLMSFDLKLENAPRQNGQSDEVVMAVY